MQSLRRVTAIVLNVLLIQVSLAGYWAACGPDSLAMDLAMDAAAGMSHEGHGSQQTERACLELSTDADCAPPSAPGGCAALTTCAASALPARTQVMTESTPPRDAPSRELAMVRQAPRPAPDLPPPRA